MRFISLWLVNGHASQLGLVFCSYIKLLGIRYFQRPCASYHFGILCILVGSCLMLIQTILGIRYFQWPCTFIIVVCQASLSVLYFVLRFHISIYMCVLTYMYIRIDIYVLYNLITFRASRKKVYYETVHMQEIRTSKDTLLNLIPNT